MVARLTTAGGDTVTNADLNAFLALATAEQQLIFALDRAVAAQVAFNTSDPAPDPLINRVAVVPSANGIGAQLSSSITADAPTRPIYEAATTFGAGESPLAIEPGDTVTDTTLNEFLSLTLAGQIVFLAATVQSAESAYNTANPTTPRNVVTVSPNFDQNTVGVSVLLPLAGTGNASLVGALPF